MCVDDPKHQRNVFGGRFQEAMTCGVGMQIPSCQVSEVSIQDFEGGDREFVSKYHQATMRVEESGDFGRQCADRPYPFGVVDTARIFLFRVCRVSIDGCFHFVGFIDHLFHDGGHFHASDPYSVMSVIRKCSAGGRNIQKIFLRIHIFHEISDVFCITGCGDFRSLVPELSLGIKGIPRRVSEPAKNAPW